MEAPAVDSSAASTTATVAQVAREPMPDAAIAAVALDAARDRSAVAAFASTSSSGVDSFRLPPTEDPPLMAAAAAATTRAPESEAPAEIVDETSAPSIGSEPARPAESSVAAEMAPVAEPVPGAAAIVATPAEVAPPKIAPEETPTPEPQAQAPAEPQAPAPAEAPAAPPPSAGPPNLTIRITSRGLMTAELDGEIEHVMLDDLGPYAEALSHVAGTATIHVPNDEGMPALIGKRAQRILEDAGVQVTLA
jgi:hypothetical protein